MTERDSGGKFVKGHHLGRGRKRPDITGDLHFNKRPEIALKISESKTGKKRPDMQGANNPMRRPEIRAKFLGENHPLWIKDRTQLVGFKRRAETIDSLNWRRHIRLRDKVCQLLNEECKGRLEVHHIYPWKSYPKLRYEKTNGILVCQFHHPRGKNEEIMVPVFMAIISRIYGRNMT